MKVLTFLVLKILNVVVEIELGLVSERTQLVGGTVSIGVLHLAAHAYNAHLQEMCIM